MGSYDIATIMIWTGCFGTMLKALHLIRFAIESATASGIHSLSLQIHGCFFRKYLIIWTKAMIYSLESFPNVGNMESILQPFFMTLSPFVMTITRTFVTNISSMLPSFCDVILFFPYHTLRVTTWVITLNRFLASPRLLLIEFENVSLRFLLESVMGMIQRFCPLYLNQ